eukprot:9135-Heterococcus_DN1.PRE.2
MHACTDDAKLCFDSAGKAYESCSEFAGSECVNGECVCKTGYTLTTANVYIGNSAAAFKLQRTCIPKVLVCNTGVHSEANRVCMRTAILLQSFGARAFVGRLSCEDDRIFGPGFDSSVLFDDHSFQGKSCIEGRCRCLKGQTLIRGSVDVAGAVFYHMVPNYGEICAALTVVKKSA